MRFPAADTWSHRMIRVCPARQSIVSGSMAKSCTSIGTRQSSRTCAGAVGGKAKREAKEGDNFPSWVLDQLGIEYMLANRVAMGPVWYRRVLCGTFRRTP